MLIKTNIHSKINVTQTLPGENESLLRTDHGRLLKVFWEKLFWGANCVYVLMLELFCVWNVELDVFVSVWDGDWPHTQHGVGLGTVCKLNAPLFESKLSLALLTSRS